MDSAEIQGNFIIVSHDKKLMTHTFSSEDPMERLTKAKNILKKLSLTLIKIAMIHQYVVELEITYHYLARSLRYIQGTS